MTKKTVIRNFGRENGHFSGKNRHFRNFGPRKFFPSPQTRRQVSAAAVCLTTYLCVFMCVHMSAYMHVCLIFCLAMSVCLYVCMPICLDACLSGCLSLCLSIG